MYRFLITLSILSCALGIHAAEQSTEVAQAEQNQKNEPTILEGKLSIGDITAVTSLKPFTHAGNYRIHHISDDHVKQLQDVYNPGNEQLLIRMFYSSKPGIWTRNFHFGYNLPEWLPACMSIATKIVEQDIKAHQEKIAVHVYNSTPLIKDLSGLVARYCNNKEVCRLIDLNEGDEIQIRLPIAEKNVWARLKCIHKDQNNQTPFQIAVATALIHKNDRHLPPLDPKIRQSLQQKVADWKKSQKPEEIPVTTQDTSWSCTCQ